MFTLCVYVFFFYLLFGLLHLSYLIRFQFINWFKRRCVVDEWARAKVYLSIRISSILYRYESVLAVECGLCVRSENAILITSYCVLYTWYKCFYLYCFHQHCSDLFLFYHIQYKVAIYHDWNEYFLFIIFLECCHQLIAFIRIIS